MFFGPAALNVVRNFIFKLWIEEKKPCAHFGIHKRSPKRSPWSSETKNTPKSWRKFELHLFQSTLNCHSGAPFWAPIFTYLKSTECQLSLEKNYCRIFSRNFFSSLWICVLWRIDFWSSGASFRAPKLKMPYHFFENLRWGTSNEIKIWVFIESSWFLIPDNIQDLSNHIFEKY